MPPTKSETTPLIAGAAGLRGTTRSSSRRGGNIRAHHQYAAVAVFEVEASGEAGSPPAERKSGDLVNSRRRAVGSVGILLTFGLAVVTLHQKQQLKQQLKNQQQTRPYGNTYRGMFQQVRQETDSSRR